MIKVIDLFAGAGGFSEGAKQAGCKVVWAADYWKEAVKVYAINHPETVHTCQDLQQADFSELPSYDVLLAGLSCRGHFRARGTDKPKHDSEHRPAWAVVSCVEASLPKAFVIENVVEFTQWTLFDIWSSILKELNYSLKVNTINAMEFGVPQSRERVVITGSRLGPALKIKSPELSHVPFKNIVDPSAGGWSCIDGKSDSIKSQWMRGAAVNGPEFIIAHYSNEKFGRSLNEPLGRVTTKERFALVNGKNIRMLTRSEYTAAMGFPSNYGLPKSKTKAVHMLGSAVCPPVAKSILLQLKEQIDT